MSLNVELIRSSFEQAKPIGLKVMDYFYKTMFKDYPEAKKVFKGVDMKKQKKALLNSLVFVVANLEDPKKIKNVLSTMGERHNGYGIQPEHYEWVGASLLKSFAHFFGDAWTEELENAWADAYWWMADTMKAGARKKVSKKSTEPNITDMTHKLALNLFEKAIRQEARGEFKRIAKKYAHTLLKQSIEEESKRLLSVSKKAA